MAAFGIVVGLVFTVAGPAAASAGFKTGEAFWADCGDAKAPAPRACMNYVEGVSDALSVLAPGRYCPPSNVSLDDVTAAVRGYLQAHPQERQYSAASTAALALLTVFPCKTAGNQPSQSTR